MSDYTALLKSIRTNPQDDLRRLVAADWLDEHGQPERAEIIRVQVQLAYYRARTDRPRLPTEVMGWLDALHQEQTAQVTLNGNGPCKCELCLITREGELLAEHGEVWFGTNANADPSVDFNPYDTDRCVRVSRGFISEVQCPFDWWVDRADAILREAVELKVCLTDEPLEFPRDLESSGDIMSTGDIRFMTRRGMPSFRQIDCLNESRKRGYSGGYAPGIYALTWPEVNEWQSAGERLGESLWFDQFVDTLIGPIPSDG